jgi:uncharacterized protein
MLISAIVKVSKLCNLRCVYCYETPELANKERISHQNIRKLFVQIKDYIDKYRQGEKNDVVEFIWHGGEPFVQPVSYWQEILRLEDEIFGHSPTVTLLNNVQTNLTLVGKPHLPLLKRFRVGCSFDVINDLRVDIGGNPTAQKVLDNLAWLASEGVQLGGISVISQANVDHAGEIAEFFLSRGMSFRALNIYQARDMLPQIRDAAVSFERYLRFFTDLYRLPNVQKALHQRMSIDPLSTSKRMLEMSESDSAPCFTEEQCSEKEWALLVNTNGDVYSPGDAYNPQFRYGNIFSQPLDQIIFDSPGRARRVEKSQQRIRQICGNCFLFRKGCNGTFVSHATPEEYREFERLGGCYHKFLAEMMKQESQPASVSAPIFMEKEKPKEELLYLNITYRCNSRCLFCAADVAYKESPRQLSVQEIGHLIGDRRYLQIQLSGGEPTIHPDILNIVRLCRAHSDHVALLSHGRTFQSEVFSRDVLEAGINNIIVPLYGPDSESHDHVSKVRGSFDQTIRGFEHLEKMKSRYGFRMELKLLLTRFTAPLNRQIYYFARDRFASLFDQISICPLIYSQSTLDYREEFLAPFDEMKADLFSLAREIAGDRRYRLRVNEFPPCFFPDELRQIAHPLLDHPAVRFRKFYGDDQSNEQVPMEGNAAAFRTTLKGNVLIKSCERCVHKHYCSERETPFFSAAYLQQFGEQDFHPILEAAAVPGERERAIHS